MTRGKPIPLSDEGRTALEAELRDLVDVKRPAIVARVAATRAEGDLSENAGYHDARQELGMLDGRVQVIEATLRDAVPIEVMEADGSVHLGSEVVVRDEFGDSTYRMVGAAEADLAGGKISVDSPLGQALLGRRAGDEISFETPGGARQAAVVEVR